ncbi:hypothetical protein PG996_004568 [Apiospora saccharicola]|uniref:Uncharacterized protein n=1 Tax=Apiospora saccharicola TaxID=335842 RepID=A0ABR1W4M3_9PEZI
MSFQLRLASLHELLGLGSKAFAFYTNIPRDRTGKVSVLPAQALANTEEFINLMFDLVLVIVPISVDRFSDDFELLFGGGLDNICRKTDLVIVRGQVICMSSGSWASGSRWARKVVWEVTPRLAVWNVRLLEVNSSCNGENGRLSLLPLSSGDLLFQSTWALRPSRRLHLLKWLADQPRHAPFWLRPTPAPTPTLTATAIGEAIAAAPNPTTFAGVIAAAIDSAVSADRIGKAVADALAPVLEQLVPVARPTAEPRAETPAAEGQRPRDAGCC